MYFMTKKAAAIAALVGILSCAWCVGVSERHEPLALGEVFPFASRPVQARSSGAHSPQTALKQTLETPTTTPTCPSGWTTVPSPNRGTSGSYLLGVAALSPSNIWAVGFYNNGVDRSLIEHWDGSQWSVVPSPDVGSGGDAPWDVTALSPDDVWVAGQYRSEFTYRTLMEHWDGAQWVVVPSPNVGSDSNYLNSIAALAPDDIWAVGSYTLSPGTVQQTLTLHWDGAVWAIIPSPNLGPGGNVLNGVTAIAADNVWAVGYRGDSPRNTLVMRWDGSQWSIVPSPNPATSINELNSVAGTSPQDIWAVGSYYDMGTGYHSLVEHWDGSAWSVIANPDPGPGTDGYLFGVAALSASDAWAIGYSGGVGNERTLVKHWNGAEWAIVPSPNPGSASNMLYDLAAISPGEVWAVGHYNEGDFNPYHTLVERYAPVCTTPLVGHVTWQGPPAQPNALQALPITLTLRPASGGVAHDYTGLTTDASGFFTAPSSSLPSGTYNWRVKGPKYLANSGSMTLTAGATNNAEMGLQEAGDCNNDNVVNAVDFAILKASFGKSAGQPGYDDRADFNGDQAVNAADFSLLRATFGLAGAPPIGPGVRATGK